MPKNALKTLPPFNMLTLLSEQCSAFRIQISEIKKNYQQNLIVFPFYFC